MNLQSQAVSAALALFPVYPPQWVTPVQPPSIAEGGIPLSAFTPQGLEVIILPETGLQNWVVAAFDVVTLYVNGIRTNVSKTIMPGEEGDRFLLYLPEYWFSNGVNDVIYRVTRVSGNTADSPTLQLLYHNPAPTITVSHPPSIGPGQPAVITITIGYARPYDTVTLTIGTWSITFTNPDPTKPITHTLTAAELQQIGDGTHSVRARVIDQLTNSNVSATSSITISANQKVYNPPIIVEGEPGKILDVPALNGKDATIHALTWTGMVDGQPCWLKLLGFKADGSAHDLQLWNGLPARTNPNWISQGKYPQPVLNSYLAQLGDGRTLTVQFWVSEDKSNNFATATKFADQVYTIKAVALVNPTIISVTTAPGGVEIPHNGSTTATSINVTGAASVMQSIEILVNGQSKATLTTKADGSFSQILSDFIFDARTDIQVRALYADNPVSPIRSFVVRRPLQIDDQQMTLHGLTVKTTAFPVLRDSPGNTETRVASNGVLPYKYRSLNPNVASVDANGKTVGISNGDTRIEITDGSGDTLSYAVSVRNVYRLAINNTQQNFPTAINWMSQVGGSPVTAVALNNIILIYGQWMPISLHYWLCDPQAGHANGRTFFHHEYRSIHLADPRAAYLGAWCLIYT